MNLLEHYIKNVVKIEHCFDSETNMKFIIATMEVDCYGNKETIARSYKDISELNKDLAKGYFLG